MTKATLAQFTEYEDLLIKLGFTTIQFDLELISIMSMHDMISRLKRLDRIGAFKIAGDEAKAEYLTTLIAYAKLDTLLDVFWLERSGIVPAKDKSIDAKSVNFEYAIEGEDFRGVMSIKVDKVLIVAIDCETVVDKVVIVNVDGETVDVDRPQRMSEFLGRFAEAHQIVCAREGKPFPSEEDSTQMGVITVKIDDVNIAVSLSDGTLTLLGCDVGKNHLFRRAMLAIQADDKIAIQAEASPSTLAC